MTKLSSSTWLCQTLLLALPVAAVAREAPPREAPVVTLKQGRAKGTVFT